MQGIRGARSAVSSQYVTTSSAAAPGLLPRPSLHQQHLQASHTYQPQASASALGCCSSVTTTVKSCKSFASRPTPRQASATAAAAATDAETASDTSASSSEAVTEGPAVALAVPGGSPEQEDSDSGSTMVPADLNASAAVSAAVQFALNLARVSEVYEVHPWMLLLGLLKQERSIAAAVLVELGLTDLYGAWHEVLWALHASDGLQPRSFLPDVSLKESTFRIINGGVNFAAWHQRDIVETQDLLLAFAADATFDALFPDLDLSFDAVRASIEKKTGRKYDLPQDEEDGASADAPDSDISDPEVVLLGSQDESFL